MSMSQTVRQQTVRQQTAEPSEHGLYRRLAIKWRRLVNRLAALWRSTRLFYRVLLFVRFSLLLALISAFLMLANDQAQDVLRALGEQPDWRIPWFVLAALLFAFVAWWAARVMFYFRFEHPASHAHVFAPVKAYLPRFLGALVLAAVGLALLKASWTYDGWIAGPGAILRWLAVLFGLLAAGFVYATLRRRTWFARWVASRPKNLTSLAQLSWQDWLPLLVAGLAGFGLMIWFAYRAVEIAPYLGTATIALLAAAALIPTGNLLVYAGNRYNLPVISLVFLWAVICMYWNDPHLVRLSGETELDVSASKLPDPKAYFGKWVADLGARHDGPIPVFVVAAEGGGIRAAYWTALVLSELQDQAHDAGFDFARHVFAISGVSGGSLGAATFAAVVANDDAGRPARATPACDEPAATVRQRTGRVLARDFLSPTVAAMLFKGLFQQFVPIHLGDDRAVVLERSWEAAWRECEPEAWFARPSAALWSGEPAFDVPLLFLNSTVVETGQRLIAAPVSITESTFSEALDSQSVIGPAVPLSTAVHNSARFTYVSPAGTVRHQKEGEPDRWIRLVDGGYFENSGAVTAAEILALIKAEAEARDLPIRPIVIHISNDPEVADPEDLEQNQRRWLAQLWAPLDALLAVRPARGFQAREDLARRVLEHVHFRLCRGEVAKPLPLGWTLFASARQEIGRQLGSDTGPNLRIAERNRANRQRVIGALADQLVPPNDEDPWSCPS